MNSAAAQAFGTYAVRLRPPLPCGEDWLERQVSAAAEAGFNTVVVDAFSRGMTCFPCEAACTYGLPRLHSVFAKIDLLGSTAEAALRNGIRLVAAIDCLHAGKRDEYPASPLARRSFRDWRLAAPAGWLGQHVDVQSSDLLLCPSNPDIVDFLGSMAAEMSAGYPIHGIHLSGLQFGSNEGEHLGLCHCVHCSSRNSGKAGREAGAASWDAYRLSRISYMVAALKARARLSRRTLRIWGEFPTLPGATADFVTGEFDQELFDIDVIRVTAPLDNMTHSAGVELATFKATIEESHNEFADTLQEMFPFGYICEWDGREPMDPAKIHMKREVHTTPPDMDPLAAARYWLDVSAREQEGRAGNCARQCLVLLPPEITPDEAPLEQLHALLEPALPQEGSVEDSALTAPMVRAFALLRLAMMMKTD